MKKLLFLLLFIPFLGTAQVMQEIVNWTFPTGQLADTLQNGSNTLNLSSTIRIEGAGPITMTNGQVAGDYAATSTGWDNGMDSKNWNISFKTNGYDHVKIYSRQRAGGNNGGPKDFKLQWKVGSSNTWSDVTGGTVILANNWTSGVIDGKDLPDECQNQSNTVFLRWIMTSNNDVNGGTVAATGISKIDEILVAGMLLTDIGESRVQNTLYTYPNPSSGAFSIVLPARTSQVEIYGSNGQLVANELQTDSEIKMEKALTPGLYFIKSISDSKVTTIKHIVK